MILIGTDDGLYRWFEGNPWPTFHSLQGRAIVGLDSPGMGILAAVERGGRIWESLNNGMAWRTIPVPESLGRPSALAVRGAPTELLLATKPLGLSTRVVGAPLRRSAEPTPSAAGFGAGLRNQTRALAAGASTLLTQGRPARFELASDTLAGWTRLSAPVVASAVVAPEFRALAVGSGEPATWYAAIGGAGLWRSADEGGSWQQCPGLPAEVYAIRASTRKSASVALATGDGCWVSNDSGQTWEDRSGGLEKARHLRAIEVKPGAPDVMLAGAGPPPGEPNAAPYGGLGFSLYETSNGGKTWSHVKRGHPEVLEYDTITDIRYDPAAPDNVVIALGSGELWVSRNGGAYWGPLARQIRAVRVLCAVG